MYRFYIVTIALALFAILPTQAQVEVSQYMFQSSIQPYEPVTGGFVLGTATTDDQVFIDSTNLAGGFSPQTGAGFYIGFPFTYGNRVFTHLAVSADGMIRLGNGNFTIRRNTLSMQSQTGSDSADFNNVLAIYNADLQAQTDATIRIVRLGTPGNRICIVQWSNYKPFGTTYQGDVLNFQIQLREATMSVVYHFGTWVRNTSNHTAGLGLRGRNNNYFHNRVIRTDSSSNWVNSRRTFARGNQVVTNADNIPPSGLRYEFFYLPPTPNDLSLTSIIIDPSLGKLCKPTAPTPIGVRVRNRGTAPQSSFQVGYLINNNAPVLVDVNLSTPLAPGATDSVFFTNNPADFTNAGLYKLTAFVNLASEEEEYRFNDTLKLDVNIIDTLSVPSVNYTDFSQAVNNGFRTAKGATAPTQFVSNGWGASTVSGTPTFAVSFPLGSTTSPTVVNDWFINGPYVRKPGMSLIFRAAVRLLSGTVTPNMGDDVVNIVYSTDCGQTWSTLFTINQSAIQNNTLTVNLKPFEVSLDAINSNFLLALRAHTNTPNTGGNAYAVHFTDLKIKVGNDFDITPIAFTVADTTSPNCNITRANMRMRVRNLGNNPVSSFTASYIAGSGPAVNKNVTLSTPLLTGQETTVTFVGTQALNITTGGIVNVTGYTTLPGETFFTRQNDTIRTVIFQRNNTATIALPDSNRFESAQQTSNWFLDDANPFGLRVRPQRGLQNSGALSGIVNVNSNFLIAATPKYGPIEANTKMRFFYRFVEEIGGQQGAQFQPRDSVVLSASENCGLTGRKLHTFNSQTHTPTFTYRALIVDLADLAGSTPIFSLVGNIRRSDIGGARFEIDNLYIGELIITAMADEIVANDRFAIMPNPAKDFVQVELFNKAKNCHLIEVVDVAGRVVQQHHFDQLSDRYTISVAGLKNGLYALRVHFGNKVSTQKLLINR